MDNLNNWVVSGYTGTGKCTSPAPGPAPRLFHRVRNDLQVHMSKMGTTVTLAYKIQYTGLDSGEYLAVDVSKVAGPPGPRSGATRAPCPRPQLLSRCHGLQELQLQGALPKQR
jgi:hypothetical protein